MSNLERLDCVLACVVHAAAPRERAGPGNGMRRGALWLATLALLGALREALGSGTVFAGLDPLLAIPVPEMRVSPRGLLVALLPPGGFALLALILAARSRQARP